MTIVLDFAGTVYTVSFEATDMAGSPATTLSSEMVKAALPLMLTITSPIDGSYVNSRYVTVQGSLSKPAFININGIDYGYNWNIPMYNSISLVEGENTITVTATDQDGYMTTSTVKVICDTHAPEITLKQYYSWNALTVNNMTVTGTIDDSTAKVTAGYWDYAKKQYVEKWTVTVTGNTFVINGLQLNEGWTLIEVKAVDAAGNINMTAAYAEVDTIPPVITITSPADGSYSNSKSITITGTTSEYSEIVANNIYPAMYDGTYTGTARNFSIRDIALTEGENTITMDTTDLLGVHSTCKCTHS